jgi:hypothetical protein
MLWIKVILVGCSLALLFYFVVAARKRPMQKLAMMAVFLLIIVFALFPDLSNVAAHLVGVGRGVDLVFYLSIVVLLFLVFNLYLGQKTVEDQLTIVVRELAVAQAEQHGQKLPPTPAPKTRHAESVSKGTAP